MSIFSRTLPAKKTSLNKLVLAIKIIIASAAIIFLPIGDYLMCCCFVLPPSYQAVRKFHPYFNRFTALFICNGVVGACMAAALAMGIDIEGVTVGMMAITAILWVGLSHSEFRWTNLGRKKKESGRTSFMAQRDDLIDEPTIKEKHKNICFSGRKEACQNE